MFVCCQVSISLPEIGTTTPTEGAPELLRRVCPPFSAATAAHALCGHLWGIGGMFSDGRLSISAPSWHRRRHVHCAGMGVPLRGDHFEYRHAHARAVDMPSAMPMPSEKVGIANGMFFNGRPHLIARVDDEISPLVTRHSSGAGHSGGEHPTGNRRLALPVHPAALPAAHCIPCEQCAVHRTLLHSVCIRRTLGVHHTACTVHAVYVVYCVSHRIFDTVCSHHAQHGSYYPAHWCDAHRTCTGAPGHASGTKVHRG